MKKIRYFLCIYIFYIQSVFAQDGGITGLPGDTLRKGDIQIDDIPKILRNITNFGMGIAGTIAVIFVIIGAYKILFGSLQGDKSKGRDTIIMALTGFIIATLAWFIIKFIIDNL